MYNYNNKSNQNQVRETVPTQSQNWIFPATGLFFQRDLVFALSSWEVISEPLKFSAWQEYLVYLGPMAMPDSLC